MTRERWPRGGDITQDTVQVAIETTGRQGSIAVLSGESVLQQSRLDRQARSAATLAPRLQWTLRWCRDHGHQPELLSVADGPGSFTGLRIGVTTAKTLSYAGGLPLVAVDSLAAIAAAALTAEASIDAIWVGIDAYRRQVFAGQFDRQQLLPDLSRIPSGWTAHPESVCVRTAQDWKTAVAERPPQTALAGDPRAFADLENIDLVQAHHCDAVGVGMLALRAARQNRWCDPMALVPRYLRPSAAEEKAAGSQSV